MKYQRLTTSLVAVLAILLIASEAFAGGFYLPGRGVRPLGRAGAFVASGEGNLNSLWYNPANLTLSEGMELTVDLAVVDLAFDFQRAPRVTQGGDTIEYGRVESSAAPQPIPQILIGGPTGNDDLSWAFGFYTPYMAGATFPENGPQRYTLIDNVGSAMGFLHAAVSYKLGDGARVGLGVQNAFASFRLVSTTSAYTGLHGRPEDEDLDILSKIELSDFFAPAGNIGFWVKLGPSMEAAISAQSPVFFEDGDAELTVRMPSHPEFDNARLTNNTLAASMVLPAVARVALRYVDDPIDIELAGVWEGWSAFKEIKATPNDIEVEGVPGIGSIPVGPLTIPENWKDTFSVRLGGDFKVDEALTLRAGYNFETGAVPDEYYSVFSPDSDKHTVAAGMSWAFDGWQLDAGTAYYFFSDRNIDTSNMRQINPTDAENELATVVGNGEYSSRYFVFGMGVNYMFE
ncbi:OmpP1/FadL family transporter [Persicimonas caeni]|uniref:OmpP1/FadL family transporter n=1 Tax=Persicimonas caeni TaxID=2292766 RepID=UPI00143CCC75|nr:outer membrane protein transport protein [Persicimonas caeni]